MGLNDHSYYVRREEQERASARSARDETIRSIHLELAPHYADLVSRSAPGQPRPRLSIVI